MLEGYLDTYNQMFRALKVSDVTVKYIPSASEMKRIATQQHRKTILQ